MKTKNKTWGLIKLSTFVVFFFFIFSNSVFADVINISVDISPNGDVPTITVACIVGHAYTEALYNNSLTRMLGSYGISGGIHRKFCENGTISFDGWNMNDVLDLYGGVDTWGQYIHGPFKYVIIDSTDQPGCTSSGSCIQYPLVDAWQGFNSSIYLPSANCYAGIFGINTCTLAAGPVWVTTPYTHTWSDPRKNILVPTTPGDPNNLPAQVSINGDVPAVSISCIPGHDYTLSLVHEVDDIVGHSFGAVQRIYCWPGVNNNNIAFNGFNLNTFLSNRVDPEWWKYIYSPLEYIIKDTTGIYDCDDEYCPLINLYNTRSDTDTSVYLASSTRWMTVGKGPIFYTTDNVTWFNKATTSTSGCSVDCFSNVLFIPGLEASRLYTQKTILGLPVEDQLWEPNASSDGNYLFMNSSGLPINTNIYVKDIIKETNTPLPLGFVGQNIYKGFSNMMDGLVHGGKINEWRSFSYDWRMGVKDIVDNGAQTDGFRITLQGAISLLSSNSKTGKITIIAHSNGGLVAKALLKKLKDDKASGVNNLIDKIDMVILVASPQLGTPSAIPAILHGYDQDINPFYVYSLINTETARGLARNMPGAYGLLPSSEYFNHINSPVIAFVPNILDPYMSNEISIYGQNISSYAKQKSFMLGSDGRLNPANSDILKPIVAQSNLISQAESLHADIDTLTVPENIKIIQIAGWGLDTLGGFQYNSSSTCPLPTTPGCTGKYLLDQKPIFTSDGDKTVVTLSALAMNGEKWWLNMLKFNRSGLFINNNHKNIFEVPDVLNFILNNIEKISNNYVYLSTTTPTDNTNRLRLSVHSPVSLDAYDNKGNHTGKICPVGFDHCFIEENIPNSGYYEFGEGQYINLSQADFQKVHLEGIDVGTFTFDIDVVSPNGQVVTSLFVDIPVTTQTEAEIKLNQNTNTLQLSLDVTGDGVTDFTIQPSNTFNPILYLQIMKSTISSLDISKDKKEVFDKKIDKIIKALQKEKTKKALTTIDKFKLDLQKRISRPDPRHPKPKKLSKTDAQMLLDMLNQLLDNLS